MKIKEKQRKKLDCLLKTFSKETIESLVEYVNCRVMEEQFCLQENQYTEENNIISPDFEKQKRNVA